MARAQTHGTQFWVLLACAATAGVGGGNFSSSMAKLSSSTRRSARVSRSGSTRGGNLGVAWCSWWCARDHHRGAGRGPRSCPSTSASGYGRLVWMPLAIAAAVCAWLSWTASATPARMPGLPQFLAAQPTWIMSILYIGTFGSFIGYSFALPLVIKKHLPGVPRGQPVHRHLTWPVSVRRALIGSVAGRSRVAVDRVGARGSPSAASSHGAFTWRRSSAVNEHSFPVFFGSTW